MPAGETITIIGFEESREDDDRGLRDMFKLKRKDIPVSTLRDELTAFIAKMRDVVGEVPDELGRYSVDTVTLSLEVSATGKVNLIGAGGELTGTGGIQLTLKRASAPPKIGPTNPLVADNEG